MNTRTFNKVSAIVFGLFTILLTIAGFYNWIHFALAACSANLVVTALTDNSEGKSLLDKLKQKRAA